jgi:amphi-Trp domain-containing protein
MPKDFDRGLDIRRLSRDVGPDVDVSVDAPVRLCRRWFGSVVWTPLFILPGLLPGSMPEEVLFESESDQSREQIASFLRTVADNLNAGESITLSAGDDSVTMAPPAHPTF